MLFFPSLLSAIAAVFLVSCESVTPVVPPAAAERPLAVMPGPVSEPETGVLIRGSDPRMLSFKRFLERSGYSFSFGMDARGLYVLVVPHDAYGRYLLVPYLWEHGDYAERIVLGGNDRLLAESATGVPGEVEIRVPGWERMPITPLPVPGTRLVFSHSVLSLPFDEESLVRFFYGLRDTARFPGTLAALYSPFFYGVPVSVRVLLGSAEIAFEGEVPLSSEELFLWFYTTAWHDTTAYDDAFYANILSLKIAKRLYTGMPSFLGGAVLLTNSVEVPFEEIRRYLFAENSLRIAGMALSYFYAWRGSRTEEQTVLLPLDGAAPVKAFFASPEGSSRSVVSLVVRAPDALEKRRAAAEVLSARGFAPFGELYEDMGEKDAWAALSVVVPPEREKELLSCYEQEIVPMDRTFSIGVYRVRAEDR